ncbi:MAG TPA: hypothetical protein VJP85_08425 [Candidatus Baltobacteraceae bacterium]|nr:hypothetical protein [Candidatus Baltobacteraceae bacterium]
MATKPSATTSSTKPVPGSNPMNLTCTTIATPEPGVNGPPAMVKIVIHANGNVPDPGQGWTPYLPPNANVRYLLHDDDNGDESQISGSGVAIFTK